MPCLIGLWGALIKLCNKPTITSSPHASWRVWGMGRLDGMAGPSVVWPQFHGWAQCCVTTVPWLSPVLCDDSSTGVGPVLCDHSSMAEPSVVWPQFHGNRPSVVWPQFHGCRPSVVWPQFYRCRSSVVWPQFHGCKPSVVWPVTWV